MIKLPPHSYTILSPLAAQLLHLFNSLIKLPPHFYTFLNRFAALLLPLFTPSEKIPPYSYTFLPAKSYIIFFSWQPNFYIILPPLKNYPLNLTQFYHLGSSSLTSFYALRTSTSPLVHNFNPWQPNSYIIIPPQNKLPPHSYINLSPLSDHFFHHFFPLNEFYPLWRPNSYLILPPLNKYLLTRTQFYPPWQPKSYIILPPLNKLPPHYYIILSPLADQLLHLFFLSQQITPLPSYTH